jgi:hypothetical protein
MENLKKYTPILLAAIGLGLLVYAIVNIKPAGYIARFNKTLRQLIDAGVEVERETVISDSDNMVGTPIDYGTDGSTTASFGTIGVGG